MNDLLKTFIQTWNYENPDRPIAVEDDEWGLLIYMYPNGRNGETCDIDITNDRTSADAIIVILDAIRARGYTVQILTFADSVAEPEERFQVFAWRSLNEHRKGPNDGNSAAGPTLIGCAVEVYNAIHASEEANS